MFLMLGRRAVPFTLARGCCVNRRTCCAVWCCSAFTSVRAYRLDWKRDSGFSAPRTALQQQPPPAACDQRPTRQHHQRLHHSLLSSPYDVGPPTVLQNPPRSAAAAGDAGGGAQHHSAAADRVKRAGFVYETVPAHPQCRGLHRERGRQTTIRLTLRIVHLF